MTRFRPGWLHLRIPVEPTSAPIFTPTPEGVRVNDFPAETEICDLLLDHHLPNVVQTRIRFICLNGEAEYEVIPRDHGLRAPGESIRIRKVAGGIGHLLHPWKNAPNPLMEFLAKLREDVLYTAPEALAARILGRLDWMRRKLNIQEAPDGD